VSETLPDTVPLVTVNPTALLVQPVSFASIVAIVVPAGWREVTVGLNVTEAVTRWQMTVSLVAFTLPGVAALTLSPVAAMTPSGMAVTAAINNSLWTMWVLVISCKGRGFLMSTAEVSKSSTAFDVYELPIGRS
jgi:hypothetical protein